MLRRCHGLRGCGSSDPLMLMNVDETVPGSLVEVQILFEADVSGWTRNGSRRIALFGFCL
jgi:hypothetical protein